MDTPKIYVADLAAYNNGRHHGRWFDLSEHTEYSLHEGVEELLASSPVEFAEEYAIHDSEGFGGWLGEFSGLESAVRIADLILEHGLELVSEALNHAGGCGYVDDAEEFIGRHIGCYPSKRHWAEEEMERSFSKLDKETARLMELYFDFESYADDKETNGDVTFVETSDGVHVIFNRG
jgi:antirestriction protein